MIGGRAPCVCGSLGLVVPGADAERIAHDHPAHPRLPAGLEHHRSRDVAPGRGNAHVGRTRRGSSRRRDRGSRRTRSASPSAAGTTTRRCRSARPARSSGSRTGTRSQRSAGNALTWFPWSKAPFIPPGDSAGRSESVSSYARPIAAGRQRTRCGTSGRPDLDRRDRLGARAADAGRQPAELAGRSAHADAQRHRGRRRRSRRSSVQSAGSSC